MSNDVSLRRSVVASVIASILVFMFIQPLLKWLWNLILWAAPRFYEGFTDAIYQSAALGQRPYVSVLTFIYIVVFATALITGLTASGVGFGIAIRARIDKMSPKSRTRFVRVARLITVCALITVWLSGTTIVISVFSVLQLTTSFEQRVTVLTPYVSDQEIKELHASWASMDSRTDYESINARLEHLATEHRIELPEPLLR